MDNNTGQMLKQARETIKIPQIKAAEITGVPITTLQKWEQGIRTPPVYVAKFVLIMYLSYQNIEINSLHTQTIHDLYNAINYII